MIMEFIDINCIQQDIFVNLVIHDVLHRKTKQALQITEKPVGCNTAPANRETGWQTGRLRGYLLNCARIAPAGKSALCTFT